jgi:hypothetical protein
MLRFFLKQFTPLVLVLLVTGCATDPPRPAPYYAPAQQSCRTPFNATDSTESLCRWLHTNTFGALCTVNIQAELQRRNVIVSPRSECGKPQQQICRLQFNSTDSTANLCNWWHNNSFGAACAPRIQSELNRRNVIISPRSECGNPQQQTCNITFNSSDSTESLCRWSHDNNFGSVCAPGIQAELNRRHVVTIPRSECGKPISPPQTSNTNVAQRPRSTEILLRNCAFSDLADLNALSNLELCGAVRAGGPCVSVTRTILAGRGLSANPDGSCGTVSAECGAHIGNIRAGKDPIAKSCDSRFERTADSVKCRVNTVGFLFINARRTGNNRSECGAPLLQIDFERFKSLPASSR